jgi:hypothetical protein
VPRHAGDFVDEPKWGAGALIIEVDEALSADFVVETMLGSPRRAL